MAAVTAARHGELALLVGLVASALVAALTGGYPPLEPLAALIMERTPVPIANWLLDALGPAGKPFALYGSAAMTLALAAPLALLAARGPFGRLNRPLALAMLVGATWMLARPGAWPGLVTLMALTAGTFVWLERRAGRARPAALQPPTTPVSSRREFLVRAVTNAAALAVVSALPVLASAARVVLVGRTPRTPLFALEPPAPRLAGFALAGLTPEVTSVPNFYRMSKNVADPVLDETVWSLAVAGRTGRALSLTLDDLAALPRVDRWVTMQCVSNPVGGPLWSAALFSGVPLAELLRRAEPLPDAAWVSFEAPDGHREQLPLARALDPSVLVAYGMNGEWLTPEHGFPARLLATGLYGFRSVKWLTRIEVLDRPRAGHWEERGWSAADIHTTARVDLVQPAGASGADAAGLLAAGVAFAGLRGVQRVEVRMDGGPWQEAELHAPPLAQPMWVQWRARLPSASGEVRVEARAIDGDGVGQDEMTRGQYPIGATGIHGLTVRL